MKTLAIMAQKGGAGKSTLALHLAVLAQQSGKRTLIIDADPQRSAADWWRARQADEPEMVEASPGQLAQITAAAGSAGVDLSVIDTAPHAERSAAEAASVADLVAVPCRPGILDLRAIAATVEILRLARTPAVIVINQAPPGRGGEEAGLVKEARAALAVYDVPIAPMALGMRADYSHAFNDGRAVTEFAPESRAAEEINALWAWIKARIKL